MMMIAEQIAFTPTNPRTDQTNHPWTECISIAGI